MKKEYTLEIYFPPYPNTARQWRIHNCTMYTGYKEERYHATMILVKTIYARNIKQARELGEKFYSTYCSRRR